MDKHYHFIGVGGIGMAALAALVLKKGGKVSGSDLRSNTLTEELAKAGATIAVGHSAENVIQPDFVVISSAIKEDNPEWQEASTKQIPILKRAELLAQLMDNYTAITVAGAHGKTTTSSMISHMLSFAGLDPTAAVGGIVNNSASNNQLGESEYFVAEVDESDGSFLCFEPTYSVITNVDEEHIDFYKSYDELEGAYQEFIGKTKADGKLIVYGEDRDLMRLVQSSSKPFETYGTDKSNDLYVMDTQYLGFQTYFNCVYKENLLGAVRINMPGIHNVLNALACILVGLQLSIDFNTIRESLESYEGVRRRFQLVGESEGIQVIDDYAHHPTEIQFTLRTAQQVTEGNVYVVFQPHRFSRLKHLYEDFLRCFENTNRLIVTDVYAASESPIEGYNAEQFVCDLQIRNTKDIRYLPQADIISFLMNQLQPGDMVLTLGAGDITQLAKNLFQILKQNQIKSV